MGFTENLLVGRDWTLYVVLFSRQTTAIRHNSSDDDDDDDCGGGGGGGGQVVVVVIMMMMLTYTSHVSHLFVSLTHAFSSFGTIFADLLILLRAHRSLFVSGLL